MQFMTYTYVHTGFPKKGPSFLKNKEIASLHNDAKEGKKNKNIDF